MTDEPIANTPLTLQALLDETPESFVFCGQQFSMDEETSYYNDEYVPQGYSVHDEDYSVEFVLEPVSGGTPPFIDTLWTILEDNQFSWLDVEGLTAEEIALLVQAWTGRLEEKEADYKDRLQKLADAKAAVSEQALTFPRRSEPDDHTAALLRALEGD